MCFWSSRRLQARVEGRTHYGAAPDRRHERGSDARQMLKHRCSEMLLHEMGLQSDDPSPQAPRADKHLGTRSRLSCRSKDGRHSE
eukprot:4674275-Pleurochrysis_carterae.AAC.2